MKTETDRHISSPSLSQPWRYHHGDLHICGRVAVGVGQRCLAWQTSEWATAHLLTYTIPSHHVLWIPPAPHHPFTLPCCWSESQCIFRGVFLLSIRFHITRHRQLHIDFGVHDLCRSLPSIPLPLSSVPSPHFFSLDSPHPSVFLSHHPHPLYSFSPLLALCSLFSSLPFLLFLFCLSLYFPCFHIPCAMSQQLRPAMSRICGYLDVCARACVYVRVYNRTRSPVGWEAQTTSAGQQTVFFHWCYNTLREERRDQEGGGDGEKDKNRVRDH